MRTGLIARCDLTGLGNQTRNLARMIRPDEVMLINSNTFNGNHQYPETYAHYNTTEIIGFPSNEQVRAWLKGLDVVITCEIFYNSNFVDIAKEMGVKTINHFNWEFADYLRQPHLTLPDKLVSPSHWNFDNARRLWGGVEYLPTPVFVDDFADVKDSNYARTGKKRFLHVMGHQAFNDRNGTLDLISAMGYSVEDFELVIKAQVVDILPLLDYMQRWPDPRILIDTKSPENEVELYEGFDAVIMPRRYGGQCLPMTEALCAGLPVIMTNISPNDKILPSHWLIESTPAGSFMARTSIDFYSANIRMLGERLDFMSKKDLRGDKAMAYNIGYWEFSNHELETKWETLIMEVYNR